MLNIFLKTFIIVAECGSFAKAAEKTYISSTAIMKQMNQLEQEIGLPLLVRTHQGISLTPAGESIYHDAKELVKLADEAIQRAYNKQLKENYIIRLGTSLLYPSKDFVTLWNKISSAYPQFKLRLVPFEDSKDNASLYSLGNKIDIISGAFGRPTDKKLDFLHLSDFHFAIAMPQSHPLATKKQLRYEDLHGHTMLMMPRGNSPANDAIRTEIEKEHPQINLEDAPYNYDIEIFNRCEEENKLLLTLDGWQDLHPSLITIPLTVPYKLPYGLIYSTNPNEATKLFINIVRQKYSK